VRSYLSALIVGWRNEDVVRLLRLVPHKWVAPSLQPVEVGLVISMGCTIPQPFTAGGNRPYSEVLGHNRWPVISGVNYTDTTSLVTTYFE
jgi:hypothetical protein